MYENLPLRAGSIRLVTINQPKSDNEPVQCNLECYDLCSPSIDHNVKTVFESRGSYWDDSARLSDIELFFPSQTDHLRNSGFKSYHRNASRSRQGQSATSRLTWRYPWPGDYIALSYTWGDENDRKEIIVNGQPMMVTRNLEAALRRLRKKMPIKQGMKVWIDAICTNQGSKPEKNKEVPRMWEIYKQS